MDRDDWIPVESAFPILGRGPNQYSDHVLIWSLHPEGVRARCGLCCRHRNRFESTRGGTTTLPINHRMPMPEGPT